MLHKYIYIVYNRETNNYTKRILHSPTDHYINTRAMNWKKLPTEELNKSIPCHRSTQMKNKSHMLVCKTHHSIVLGFITFPRDNFQSNLTCFHIVAKKILLLSWMLVGGFHHTSTNLTLEKNICIC